MSASIWYNGTTEPQEPLEAAVEALEENVVPAIPIPKATAVQSEALYLMLHQRVKPAIVYRGGEMPPAYKICDIKLCLHPTDYKQFIKDIEPIGEVDGEAVVYALDYVRWVLSEES